MVLSPGSRRRPVRFPRRTPHGWLGGVPV